MRVHSTKAFLFTYGDEKAHIKDHDIADLPDWVAKTLLFELATKDGSLTVIENNTQLVKAQNGESLAKSKDK